MFWRRIVPSRLTRRLRPEYIPVSYDMFMNAIATINQQILVLAENDQKIAEATAKDIRKLTKLLQQQSISISEWADQVTKIINNAIAKAERRTSRGGGRRSSSSGGITPGHPLVRASLGENLKEVPTPTPGVHVVVDKDTGRVVGFHDYNRQQSTITPQGGNLLSAITRRKPIGIDDLLPID